MRSESIKLAKRGLRVGRTAVGKGVFASKRFVDGSCIGQIEGEVIDDPQYVSRYAFSLEDGTQLEPQSPFRFVNHSCEPNCAFDVFRFPAAPVIRQTAVTVAPAKILLFAICDIERGEELTIDYRWPASFAIPCRCQAIHCRGWIVNPDEREDLMTKLALPLIA